ncbi:MAG: Stk1 family PASTA domain-containing Ser/Thr kinase [Clostridium luticellarii]|jgi:serine/threonine-protein kinase|uniref:non-specific serine/threonine protein kinase n=1 Tax=Clostridium luticellarii TaxID=1691940 RepID=A0A2T0BRH6_9CLOT|nr:Stk1 family PASTA domain-containing Ser/Thr kinase [Clostridium luticellarii]MCI1994488.1 Stk1 family PASTA domain-containing Ser/Thr kinase [Clostridium luticellarii]MCI2038559.1 Stk1 family PASTA domain-containing Ser/Thr kinase [Clostridium luticellarii]PRR86432.1 Serine/threonine-protein kinase PrkC [Clostridium luticellarii]
MIGIMLGNRYEPLEKIGEGGMAVVYRATDHLLNRNVAVKVLKEQFSSDSEFVQKFKREATAAASLSDNNIVNIYDVGTQDDINYIVMEYVSGKTLKQIIKEEVRIPSEKTIEIAIQIAKAIKCAHKNNIIHRDIKPHNILVTEDGIVKVTDFGIAKASNSVTITNSNKIMGSAHYFSPEQAKGSFVDFRTDIYSLGIVMYEMVTGRVPYDAESPVSIALKHIQEPVVPPIKLNENVPESLNKLILKAVEKEPIKRYQTMEDMLVDLKKIENNQKLNLTEDDLNDDMTRIMDPVDVNDSYNNEEDYGYEDELEDKKPKPVLDSKKKKTILIVALFMLVIVIGAVSGYFAFSKHGNSVEAAVPNIVGMKQDEAKKLVESKKLNFVVGAKEKSDKPEGTVIECFPKAGTKVKVNSDVRVIISEGTDTMGVPNVVGIDLNTAKNIISSSGLSVGNISYRYSDTVSQGQVISQDPEADSKVKDGAKVNLVVSKGAEVKYVTVPDVSGRSIGDAEAILKNAGLRVAQNPVETSDKTKENLGVTNQSVGASQQVKEGTTVTLTYYVYKEPENKDDNGGSQNNNTEENSGNGTGENGGGQNSGGQQNENGNGGGSQNNGGSGNNSGGDKNPNPGTTGN